MIHFAVIARILGILLMLFSLAMLPPIIISFIFNDGVAQAFVTAMIMIFSIGFTLWLPVRQEREELRTRDGFIISALFWITLGLAGTLPFMLADKPRSEEHTSELQSRPHLVCRLLLEKKKKNTKQL